MTGTPDPSGGEGNQSSAREHADWSMSFFPVVLAGPSGSGKTSVARRLLDLREDVVFSVSSTTRDRRPGERDGLDYRFIDREEFMDLREEDALLEWAEVHDHFYGTPRVNLERARASGAHLLLDIDVQGARSVRKKVPEAVTIFLLPPSGAEILRRLRGRGTEDLSRLRRRLRSAESELASAGEFDYAVVNDDLARTVRTVEAVIVAEQCRIERLGSGVIERADEIVSEIHEAAGEVLAAEGRKNTT